MCYIIFGTQNLSERLHSRPYSPLITRVLLRCIFVNDFNDYTTNISGNDVRPNFIAFKLN